MMLSVATHAKVNWVPGFSSKKQFSSPKIVSFTKQQSFSPHSNLSTIEPRRNFGVFAVSASFSQETSTHESVSLDSLQKEAVRNRPFWSGRRLMHFYIVVLGSYNLPDVQKLGVVVKPLEKPRLVLKFIWMEKNIGISLDQVIPGHGTIPLSPYYFWPRKDAWEELKVMLESKPWISQKQTIILLNQATDIINLWQQSGGELA